MKCRHCGTAINLPLVDLGSAPPSNAYLTEASMHAKEGWYPLRVLVCEQCWLVQTEDFADVSELFDENYGYFSGFSKSWLDHCEHFVENIEDRFLLDSTSHVVEVAANDGYLLQYVKARGIPCTGIEPTKSTAAAARAKQICIIEDFFGLRLANELVSQEKQADFTIANNVLAHVPNINDFVSGFSVLLKRNGVASFEFPYLLRLISENQFDTIYHEHFSYLSLTAVDNIFQQNGLKIFDVEELKTHGGSLRVFAQRIDSGTHLRNKIVDKLLASEKSAGIATNEFYKGFQEKTYKIKYDFLMFLLNAKKQGKSVIAYGAAAKGNTLLNYSGIRQDLISYVTDLNPNKQGKFMPGSRIPIVHEDMIKKTKPDYVLILPWNLRDEITAQLDYIKSWGGRFVVAVPNLNILN